jgi:hypothetical protein
MARVILLGDHLSTAAFYPLPAPTPNGSIRHVTRIADRPRGISKTRCKAMSVTHRRTVTRLLWAERLQYGRLGAQRSIKVQTISASSNSGQENVL